MNKIIKVFLWVILCISVVMSVLYYMNGTHAGTPDCDKWTQNFLTWAYVLFFIALLCVVILPFILPKTKKTNWKRTGLILVSVVVVLLVSFFLASDANVITSVENDVSPFTLKLVDANLILAYILTAIAFLSIIIGALRNSFSKK